MPIVTLVLNESADAAGPQTYDKPMIFSVESDYNHGVEDDTLLSAIKHNKEISLSSHISRLEAEWNPDFNHRFIASYVGDFGDRHAGTSGTYERITEIEDLEESIEKSQIHCQFDFKVFKVRFGGAEKTFSSNDVFSFLLSILIENENVDITHESCFVMDESKFSRIISSTSFFNVEMDYHYFKLNVTRL